MSSFDFLDAGLSIGMFVLGIALSIVLIYFSYRVIFYVKSSYEDFSGKTIQVVVEPKKKIKGVDKK